jgi:hypothetical protein
MAFRRGYDPSEEDARLAAFYSLTGISEDQLYGDRADAFLGVQETPKTPDWYESPQYTGSATIGDIGAAYDSSPVELTERPTSSSDATRPRTLAAGYQLYVGQGKVDYTERKGKLTVMFRDGTLYNFYDVSPSEWLTFKGSLSKGPLLNKDPIPGQLLRHPHGPADLTNVPESVQRSIARSARVAQMVYTSKSRRIVHTTKGAEFRKVVPKSAQGKLSPRRGLGTNPATANRPPK